MPQKRRSSGGDDEDHGKGKRRGKAKATEPEPEEFKTFTEDVLPLLTTDYTFAIPSRAGVSISIEKLEEMGPLGVTSNERDGRITLGRMLSCMQGTDETVDGKQIDWSIKKELKALTKDQTRLLDANTFQDWGLKGEDGIPVSDSSFLAVCLLIANNKLAAAGSNEDKRNEAVFFNKICKQLTHSNACITFSKQPGSKVQKLIKLNKDFEIYKLGTAEQKVMKRAETDICSAFADFPFALDIFNELKKSKALAETILRMTDQGKTVTEISVATRVGNLNDFMEKTPLANQFFKLMAQRNQATETELQKAQDDAVQALQAQFQQKKELDRLKAEKQGFQQAINQQKGTIRTAQSASLPNPPTMSKILESAVTSSYKSPAKKQELYEIFGINENPQDVTPEQISKQGCAASTIQNIVSAIVMLYVADGDDLSAIPLGKIPEAVERKLQGYKEAELRAKEIMSMEAQQASGGGAYSEPQLAPAATSAQVSHDGQPKGITPMLDQLIKEIKDNGGKDKGADGTNAVCSGLASLLYRNMKETLQDICSAYITRGNVQLYHDTEPKLVMDIPIVFKNMVEVLVVGLDPYAKTLRTKRQFHRDSTLKFPQWAITTDNYIEREINCDQVFKTIKELVNRFQIICRRLFSHFVFYFAYFPVTDGPLVTRMRNAVVPLIKKKKPELANIAHDIALNTLFMFCNIAKNPEAENIQVFQGKIPPAVGLYESCFISESEVSGTMEHPDQSTGENIVYDVDGDQEITEQRNSVRRVAKKASTDQGPPSTGPETAGQEATQALTEDAQTGDRGEDMEDDQLSVIPDTASNYVAETAKTAGVLPDEAQQIGKFFNGMLHEAFKKIKEDPTFVLKTNPGKVKMLLCTAIQDSMLFTPKQKEDADKKIKSWRNRIDTDIDSLCNQYWEAYEKRPAPGQAHPGGPDGAGPGGISQQS